MKIIPGKASPSAPIVPGFSGSEIVMYENDGVALLAAVLSFKKQRYVLLNERGREVELPSNRLYSLPGRLPAQAGTIEQRSAYFAELRASATAASQKIQLGELWQLVHEDPREYSPHELTELYFSETTLLHELAMRLALLTDRTYFKRGREDYSPRPQETVTELLKAAAARQEKERIRGLVVEAFRHRLENRSTPLPSESRPIIRLLEDLAATADLDLSQQKEAKELLELCIEELHLELHGSREQQASLLLEKLGHFGPDENLSIIRHRPALVFSQAALLEANTLVVASQLADFPPEDQGRRLDLTGLECITIDDATTKDMDDALSLEHVEDGYRLGIHVSDVTCAIPREGAVDHEALLRATSIYLPERTIHMLPDCLATDKLSLVAGQVRPCLSCLYEIDHNLQVRAGIVVPSLIKVRRRYDYDEIDRILEGESGDLGVLYNIALNHENVRLDRGATKILKHDLVIVLKDGGDFELKEIDEHGPARGLIGEMMVLGNMLLARYAIEHKLAMVFRLQDPPDDQEISQVPAGPAYEYAQRARLKKSSTSVTPGLHSSLAVEAYVQATSPIRRYIDLCNQRQILHHLQTGNALYSPHDLTELIQRTEEPLGIAGAVSKETKRYWLLRYLKRKIKRGSQDEQANHLQATVLRTDLKNPLVELDEVFMPALIRTNASLHPGDRITVRIAAVDPRIDYLKLEMV